MFGSISMKSAKIASTRIYRNCLRCWRMNAMPKGRLNSICIFLPSLFYFSIFLQKAVVIRIFIDLNFSRIYMEKDGDPLNLQLGVYRVNCIDCLDRTNVVQVSDCTFLCICNI